MLVIKKYREITLQHRRKRESTSFTSFKKEMRDAVEKKAQVQQVSRKDCLPNVIWCSLKSSLGYQGNLGSNYQGRIVK